MTPEQIARAIVSEPDWRQCELASGELDFDRLREHIASAIRDDRKRLIEQVLSILQHYPGQSKVGYIRSLLG